MFQDPKTFLKKIINCFTPNMPIKVKDFVDSDENLIIYVTMFYGNEIPSWKTDNLNFVQMKVSEYTQKNTIICKTKKEFETLKMRYGLSEKPKMPDEDIFS